MHGAQALHVEPHLMIEIIGQGQDDFVAGPGQRQHREAEGLVAAGCDQRIGRVDARAIEGAHIGGQCLAQGWQALDIGVACRGRLADDPGQMIGQFRRRRIAGHGLRHIDQRLVAGKFPAFDPAMGFGNGRCSHGCEKLVDMIGHGRLI
jgi:hypothetical protein